MEVDSERNCGIVDDVGGLLSTEIAKGGQRERKGSQNNSQTML